MKRHLKAAVVTLAVLTLASGVVADPVTTGTFTRVEDVIYGRKCGMALTLDVFRPTAQANGAGLIFIVSSGWGSSHDAISIPYMEPFLMRGYTVFAVVHSSAPKFSIPEIIPDVNRAVRYIRLHAGDYGVDPMRLGATGLSAGAHLALILGTQGKTGPADAKDPVERESSAVQAVACFFPPTDFNNFVRPDINALNETVLKNYRKSIGEIPDDQQARDELGRSISPIYSITPKTAPTLIVHGEKDQHVLIHQATSFVEAAKKAGVDAEVIIKKGMPHGHWPDMKKDIETCADWFDSHLGVAKASSSPSPTPHQ